MADLNERISITRQQEQELQFTQFNSETALAIGLAMIERARREGQTLAVDIRLNGHELFHYSSPGTTPDNDEWLRYKRNTVDRFRVSSYLFGLTLQKEGKTMQDRNASPSEYAPWAGGFPVTIRNTGVVGSIAVSGLKGSDDHDYIVWAIQKAELGLQGGNTR